MENINKKLKQDENLNYKLKIAFEEAKKNKSFNELIESINLNDDELMKYTSSLENSALECNNCTLCKGLFMCKNSVTGYCYLPILMDGKLSFSYVACKYKNKYLKETEYQNKVTTFDVPKEIKEAKMKDIYIDDENRVEVIKWITNYIKEYKKGKIQKGLYLHGNFGCGKTYLIAAMFNELAKEKVKSVIIYYPEYLRNLKASYSSSSSDEFKDKFNEVKYAKLLLIDDLGAEAVTNWSRDEVLGTILQYRMQENLPTFITSNLNLKELEEHLSVTTNNKSEKVKARRIIERIRQLTVDMEMISKNNRV